jgi:hypothetical protein
VKTSLEMREGFRHVLSMHMSLGMICVSVMLQKTEEDWKAAFLKIKAICEEMGWTDAIQPMDRAPWVRFAGLLHPPCQHIVLPFHDIAGLHDFVCSILQWHSMLLDGHLTHSIGICMDGRCKGIPAKLRTLLLIMGSVLFPSGTRRRQPCCEAGWQPAGTGVHRPQRRHAQEETPPRGWGPRAGRSRGGSRREAGALEAARADEPLL